MTFYPSEILEDDLVANVVEYDTPVVAQTLRLPPETHVSPVVPFSFVHFCRSFEDGKLLLDDEGLLPVAFNGIEVCTVLAMPPAWLKS